MLSPPLTTLRDEESWLVHLKKKERKNMIGMRFRSRFNGYMQDAELEEAYFIVGI